MLRVVVPHRRTSGSPTSRPCSSAATAARVRGAHHLTDPLYRDFSELSARDLSKDEQQFGLPPALIVLLLVVATSGRDPDADGIISIIVALGITALLGQVAAQDPGLAAH